MNRGCGGGTASSITVAQAKARATTESEIEADRDDEPLPLDRTERVADLAPVRPAEVDGGARGHQCGDDRTDPHPTVARQRAHEPPHAVTAGRPARSTTSRYTSASRSAIEPHE